MTMVEQTSRRERRAQRKIVTAAAERPRKELVSLIASAVNVRITQNWANVRWGGTEAQVEGWVHYDNCPEFHAGVNIGAGNISRARLIGVQVDPLTNEPGTQPSDNPVVTDVMAGLFGGPSGQSQALAALYKHLEVAGDSWVLATPDPDIDGAGWEILSSSEVTGSVGGRVNIEQLNGIPRPLDFDTELLVRVWQPHPKRRWDSDSPTRALLPVLRELSQLTAMVSATVKSRLASAGILWMPEEIALPNISDEANDVTQVRSEAPSAAGWLDVITEAMTAPIADPDSASAVVPLVAMIKGDLIAKISHMEFGRDLDAMIEPLREACVKRLAIGMNLPPEVLLGVGNVNHWTGWLITEDYARAYLAPKLELIAAALTTFYLRPALKAAGVDPDLYAVYFDLDKLVPKQISDDNTKWAWENRLIKDEVAAAQLGFSTAQLSTPAEKLQRLLLEMLTRANPEVIAEIAPTLVKVFPGLVIVPITPASAKTTAPESEGAPVSNAPKAINAPPTQTPPPESGAPGDGA